MPRIAGIDLNINKRTDIALTKVYGIGRGNVGKIIKQSRVDGAKRVRDLTEEEVGKIQKAVETTRVEGDLREEVHNNIGRLKQIGSYRGSRHARNLPVRGQRTKSNARTKRGKRVTIGAIKKEMAEKMGLVKPEEAKKNEK